MTLRKRIQKTQIEIQMDKYDSIEKIVNQLESCNYENEASILSKNIAFMALKRMIKDQQQDRSKTNFR